MAGPETPATGPPWLRHPGAQDITAHVDFTTIRRAAEAAGMTALGFLDQTYFLMGLLDGTDLTADLPPAEQMKQRLALKTLLLPGGLGSTFKVLLLGKGRRRAGAQRLLVSRAGHVNLQALVGLAVLIASEVATLAGLEPFASWNTPIGWTGFILFADGVVFQPASSPRGYARRRANSSFWRGLDSALARLRVLQSVSR